MSEYLPSSAQPEPAGVDAHTFVCQLFLSPELTLAF